MGHNAQTWTSEILRSDFCYDVILMNFRIFVALTRQGVKCVQSHEVKLYEPDSSNLKTSRFLLFTKPFSKVLPTSHNQPVKSYSKEEEALPALLLLLVYLNYSPKLAKQANGWTFVSSGGRLVLFLWALPPTSLILYSSRSRTAMLAFFGYYCGWKSVKITIQHHIF